MADFLFTTMIAKHFADNDLTAFNLRQTQFSFEIFIFDR